MTFVRGRRSLDDKWLYLHVTVVFRPTPLASLVVLGIFKKSFAITDRP